MSGLLIQLVYRVGLIIMIGLIFSKTKAIRYIIEKRELSLPEKLKMGIIFGLLSILGTYTGIKYQGAIVNTRVIGVAVGGLLGGPLVGILSGFLAGGHRYLIDIGGFTAFACGVSTLSEGIVAGAISKKYRAASNKVFFALFAGFMLEILQMIILLIIARPIHAAIELVRVISFPMILVNGLGIALFISIINNIQTLSTIQAQFRARQALLLADKTTQALKDGLSRDTARMAAEQILTATDFDAVAITDRNEILSHVGAESEHHKCCTLSK